MDKNEVLKYEVKLIFHSELSGIYESECTLEEFFGMEIYKNKRLLSARLSGIETAKYVYHGTGPK